MADSCSINNGYATNIRVSKPPLLPRGEGCPCGCFPPVEDIFAIKDLGMEPNTGGGFSENPAFATRPNPGDRTQWERKNLYTVRCL